MKKRTWTTVAEDVVGRVGGRDAVAAEIVRLDWIDIPEHGSVDVAFSPGHAIKAAIRELRIPKVDRVAPYGGFSVQGGVGEDGFYPGFYGVRGHYENGTAEIYFVDTGVELIPVCSDLDPSA